MSKSFIIRLLSLELKRTTFLTRLLIILFGYCMTFLWFFLLSRHQQTPTWDPLHQQSKLTSPETSSLQSTDGFANQQMVLQAPTGEEHCSWDPLARLVSTVQILPSRREGCSFWLNQRFSEKMLRTMVEQLHLYVHHCCKWMTFSSWKTKGGMVGLCIWHYMGMLTQEWELIHYIT